MRHLLTAALVAVALPAQAADMKAPAMQAQAAAGPSWQGFYLGGHAGYGFGDIKALDEFKFEPNGFVGGGQAGYNWQYGQLVAGVEVDATWLGNRDNLTAGICEGDCGISAKYDLIGSARVRVGSTVFGPRLLAYGTGGLAWAHTTISAESMSLGNNHFGYAVGGGLEVLLGNHWTARAEFLHYDFGASTVAGVLPTKETYNVVRGAINFKF